MRNPIHGFFDSLGASPPLQFPRRPLTLDALGQRTPIKVAILVLALVAAGLNLSVPWMQRTFVNELSHGTPALRWVLLAFAATLAAQVLSFIYRLIATREGLLLQKSLSEALYRKALRLAPEERAGRTVGEIITYYAQDVSTTSQLVEDFFPSILNAALPLVLAPLALGAILEVPLGTILLVLGGSLAITFWLAMRQAYFFALNKRNAAHRLAVVNEWLQNIRILRVLGWVRPFENDITRRRITESDDRLRMVTNGSTMNSLTQSVPFLLNLTTVWALVAARGHEFSPGDVFAVLWIFGVFLARPLRTLPFTLVTWNDISTSSRRLAHFLSLADEEEALRLPATEAPPGTALERKMPALEVRNLSLNLGGRRVLNEISFELKAGEFVAIVGEVGSGKSVLLQALLRSLPATFESYRLGDANALSLPLEELRAHFAIAPQDSFIMSSTLRDNVTLTYNTPEGRDGDVAASLRVAEFDPGREHVTDGLATQIGERGVNLSGGQRQRVNLARCALFDRPLILLDDSLSAVDVDTERRLQASLLQGRWRTHTRILVTHRHSILPHVDRIFILEGGRLVEQGPPELLLRNSPRLAALAARGEA